MPADSMLSSPSYEASKIEFLTFRWQTFSWKRNAPAFRPGRPWTRRPEASPLPLRRRRRDGEAALAFPRFCETLPSPPMRSLLRSKIHNATVTEANVDYVGSITIDRDLIDAVGLWIGEKVLVVSATTGVRLETYVIEGESGSGVVGINGPAAHLINAGEVVIVMGFEIAERPVKPRIVLCDKRNRIAEYLDERAGMVAG